MLEENDLTIPEGCINHIRDNAGKDYYIPNFCINDPYFEKKLEEQNQDVKDINVRICL